MGNYKKVETNSDSIEVLLYDHSHIFIDYEHMTLNFAPGSELSESFSSEPGNEPLNSDHEANREGLESSLRSLERIRKQMDKELLKAATLVKESRKERSRSAYIKKIHLDSSFLTFV